MRILIICTGFFMLLQGCKPMELAFRPQELTDRYVKDLIIKAHGVKRDLATDTNNNIAGNEDTGFAAMRIYEAVLTDDYIRRDGIAEETIINTKSNQSAVSLAVKKNTYRLYIITAGTTANSPCIFLPSIFDARGKCIGLGPALLGTWAAGQIKYYKTLIYYPRSRNALTRALSPGRKKDAWVYDKKVNEFKGSKSIYEPFTNFASTRKEIKFEADQKSNIAGLPDFRIINIYNTAENRFGGQKPLIFDIGEIFEDPDALAFYLIKKY